MSKEELLEVEEIINEASQPLTEEEIEELADEAYEMDSVNIYSLNYLS